MQWHQQHYLYYFSGMFAAIRIYRDCKNFTGGFAAKSIIRTQRDFLANTKGIAARANAGTTKTVLKALPLFLTAILMAEYM